MKLSLVVLNPGKSAGQIIPISLAQFVIGRDPQCNLRPASALISKRHCALLIRGEHAFVRDFDSTNGTSVNETPVKGEVELSNSDLLKVGPLQFRVAIEADSPRLTATASPQKKPSLPARVTSESRDEDAAALLLGVEDSALSDDCPSVDLNGVPEGSTVMDLPIQLPASGETPPPPNHAPAKKPEPAKKKEAPGDAQAAAKAIFDKLSRRR